MFFILMRAGKFFRGKNYSCDQISSLYSNSRISSNRQEDFNRGGIQFVMGFVCEKEANNQVFFNLIRTTEAEPRPHQRRTNAAPMLHQHRKDIDIVLLFTLRLLFQILMFYVSIIVDPSIPLLDLFYSCQYLWARPARH